MSCVGDDGVVGVFVCPIPSGVVSMLQPTFRPIISVIRVTPDRSCVEVNLDMEGLVASGFGNVIGDDTMRAAGVATCEAVDRLLPDGYELSLAWVELFKRTDDTGEGHAVINVAVELRTLGRAHPETLLGAALVHHDVEVAAVRATLDGLTRRLAPAILS